MTVVKNHTLMRTVKIEAHEKLMHTIKVRLVTREQSIFKKIQGRSVGPIESKRKIGMNTRISIMPKIFFFVSASTQAFCMQDAWVLRRTRNWISNDGQGSQAVYREDSSTRLLATNLQGAVEEVAGAEEKLESDKEKRAAAPLRPLAPKRQRVAEPDLRETITDAPEKQRDQAPSPAEIVIKTQPLVNIQILAAIAQMGERFEKFVLEMRARFADSDARIAMIATDMKRLQKVVDEHDAMLNGTILAPIRVPEEPNKVQTVQRLQRLDNSQPTRAVSVTPPVLRVSVPTLDDSIVQQPEIKDPTRAVAASLEEKVRQNPQQEVRSCIFTRTKDFLAHKGPVNYVHLCKNDDILSGSTDCFKIWGKDGVILGETPCQGTVNYLTVVKKVSRDVELPCLCVGLADNTLRILGKQKSDEILCAGHKGHITCVKHFPSRTGKKSYLVSASADHTIKMWNPEDGSLIRTIHIHAGPVNALAILHQGKRNYIVSGSADKTIKICDEEGKSVRKLAEFPSSVTCLATIGNFIVVGLADETFYAWNEKDQWLKGPYLPAGNEIMHTIKCCLFDETRGLIAAGYSSKIVLCLLDLVQGNVVISYTLASDGDARRSVDLCKTTQGGYVLIYGTQSGRLKKGDVVIK